MFMSVMDAYDRFTFVQFSDNLIYTLQYNTVHAIARVQACSPARLLLYSSIIKCKTAPTP